MLSQETQSVSSHVSGWISEKYRVGPKLANPSYNIMLNRWDVSRCVSVSGVWDGWGQMASPLLKYVFQSLLL